jgi:hypothetical protein
LLAFVWIYQGLVSKVLTAHPDEIRMLSSLISIPVDSKLAIRFVGLMEILFGFVWLVPFQKRKLFLVHAFIIFSLTISAWIANPQSFVHPFSR